MKKTRSAGLARIALLALTSVVLACDDDPAGTDPDAPAPGSLTIVLDTPHDDDRALLLVVAGPDSIGLLELEAVGLSMHIRPSGEGGARVALFGPLSDGALVRFDVPDVRDAEAYSATIVEVSGPAAALRDPLTGYSLHIVAE